MEFMEVIAKRRSVRSFKAEQIKDSDLDKIILAGNAAPVGKGEYKLLQMTAVQDKEVLQKISVAASKFLRVAQDPLYEAPTLIIISAIGMPEFEHIEYSNAACIVENMLLAATDCGLGSVYLMGIPLTLQNDNELKRDLGIFESFTPVAALVVGYAKEDATERKLKRNITLTKV